jgi:hypothetical protein
MAVLLIFYHGRNIRLLVAIECIAMNVVQTYLPCT